MSDLRGLSRGSKTAAAVIVGVLLQVIVVAVLGLTAITREREDGAAPRTGRREAPGAGHRPRRGEARREGRRERDLRGRVRGARAGRPAEPRRARGGSRRSATCTASTRSAASTAATRQLYVPPEVVEQTRVDPLELDMRLRRLARLPRSTEAAVVDARRKFVADFPFHVDAERWAHAVGQALALAEDLAADPASRREDVEQEILRAYETAALNDGRPSPTRPEMAYVEARARRGGAPPPRCPSARRSSRRSGACAPRARGSRSSATTRSRTRRTLRRARRLRSVLARGGELVAVAPLPRVAGPTPRRSSCGSTARC